MRKRALVALMMAAAVLAALVRLRVGNIDAGVLVQCVFSFFAVFAATLPVPEAPFRAVRVLALIAFAASLLCAPYLRVAYFAPIALGTMTLFAVWLAGERLGKRTLFALVLLVPVTAWATLEARQAIEHRRVLRMQPADVDHVTLASPDGSGVRELRGAAVVPLVQRFAALSDFDAEPTAMRDAWRGEIVMHDGRRDAFAIGHHERGRAATWILLGQNDYVVYEAYDAVVADVLR
ncbi:MAG TPA: hypothetical protein VIF62_32340 [Labilithrix sp.]|jgi:hypothetical protein